MEDVREVPPHQWPSVLADRPEFNDANRRLIFMRLGNFARRLAGKDEKPIDYPSLFPGVRSIESHPGGRYRIRRQPVPFRGRLGLRVENDVGGPTSVYHGSVWGILRIVAIGNNKQEGRPLDHGLEHYSNPDRVATPASEVEDTPEE